MGPEEPRWNNQVWEGIGRKTEAWGEHLRGLIEHLHERPQGRGYDRDPLCNLSSLQRVGAARPVGDEEGWIRDWLLDPKRQHASASEEAVEVVNRSCPWNANVAAGWRRACGNVDGPERVRDRGEVEVLEVVVGLVPLAEVRVDSKSLWVRPWL